MEKPIHKNTTPHSPTVRGRVDADTKPGDIEDILRSVLLRSADDHIGEASSAFAVRLSQATETVRLVLGLRKHRAGEQHFDGVPLEAHLLNYLDHHAIRRLCDWFGIQDLSGHQPGSGTAIGAFSRDVQMPLEETLLRVRIGFVAPHLSTPIETLKPAAVGCRPTFVQTRCTFSPLQWEQLLSIHERDLPTKQMWRLKQLEVEIKRGYTQHA